MAVKINNIDYSGFFYNGEALTAMYLNGNKVYGSEPQEANSVEVLSTEVIDSSYDDNLHVTMDMNSSHAIGSYYMFIIEASGNFNYTYNKKHEGSGNGVLQFESLMSEDFYTENPQGYDTAIDQYWSETYNGNYNDPAAAQITVTGLPKGKYMLRFYAPTYNLQVLDKWYTLRKTMKGFFTVS